MDSRPTNKDISTILGITTREVGTYYEDSERRPDGAWLIYFNYETPQRIRQGMGGSFILLMPPK